MGRLHSRSLLQLRQQCRTHCLATPSVRNLYTRGHTFRKQSPHDPSPSELLRFTLTGSPEPLHGSQPNSSLRERLYELFNRDWPSNSPPTALWTSLKGVSPGRQQELERGLDERIGDLPTLRSAIERRVVDAPGAELLQNNDCEELYRILQRCQRQASLAEILSTLNDVAARLVRLDLSIQPQIYELGMYYAMLDLSAPALKHFLNGHHALGFPPISPFASTRMVQACVDALDAMAFESPDYDPEPILMEITGEGDPYPQDRPRLHDVLSCLRNPRGYFYLLGKLQGDETLFATWDKFLESFDCKSKAACFSSYGVVEALVQSGRPETASKFLEDISQRCGDNLPSIARFRELPVLLNDPIVGEALPDLVRGDDYLRLLETSLHDMELRMGIRWESDQEAHVGLASEVPWETFEDHPLFTMDGESAGYEHPARLHFELQTYGRSKSPVDLGRIVDLLNDGEATSISVNPMLDFNMRRIEAFRTKHPSLEFRCTFEHSPIEFTDSRLPTLHDSSWCWTPSTLGLIRARLIINGIPQMGRHCLHLMQLGSMDMRSGPDQPWQPSGYIVTWDRQFGGMLGVYVGKGHGVVNRGPVPPDAPFGALMHLLPSETGRGRASGRDRRPTFQSGRVYDGPYYLDVDPSRDLVL
ncbi:hypothetical protein NUU61_002569 [Penicillium alfredii]|uniref:Uncharacterized protein n=1 Tax=Penicillium alfredii TaxID=1506179 RepID=A0A9W9FRW1_9EURO|nr:uncharacterized protein NUU61_002569 [Penicillium alfredii]KAJ5105222.1 hypothetical protein NUU61_002569 [Penicillium alfredii]